MFDHLPISKRDAVRRALGSLGAITAIEPVSGGLSGSGVWRVHAENRCVILKVEPPPDGLNDPVRQYACMAIAAEAGVSPGLLFADAATGVALTQYIEGRPFPDRSTLLRQAGELLRRLHGAPRFPPLVDFLDGLDQLIARLQNLDLVDAAALEPVLGRWADLRLACSWGEDGLVSSHNDPNPRNLIWDGERVWLVDWQAAFLNDPMLDLAIIANYFAPEPTDEEALLGAYLGSSPCRRRLERLRLMRQVGRIYYGVMMINSAAGWVPPNRARRLQAPPHAEVIAEIANGRISLAEPSDRFAYGAAMLNMVLDGET
jgi:thiamine kinase-like enzyme